jgi:hypothetical protein
VSEQTLFELKMESSAAVVRGCCGGDHEFGECPLDQVSEAE